PPAIFRLALSVSVPSFLYLSRRPSRRPSRRLPLSINLHLYLLTALHLHLPILRRLFSLTLLLRLVRAVLPPTLLGGAGPLLALPVGDGSGAAGVAVVQLVEARGE